MLHALGDTSHVLVCSGLFLSFPSALLLPVVAELQTHVSSTFSEDDDGACLASELAFSLVAAASAEVQRFKV
jgi:hypothetical protein